MNKLIKILLIILAGTLGTELLEAALGISNTDGKLGMFGGIVHQAALMIYGYILLRSLCESEPKRS